MRPLVLLGCIGLFVSAQAEVTIDNIEAGETLRHPVVVLRGKTSEQGVLAGCDGGTMLRFPGYDNRYAAVCELKPGRNMVVVKAGADSVKIRLDYLPMKTAYRVRTVYVLASDESSTPVSIVPHGNVDAKFDVAMKLLQAFTAEAMHEAGYGRKTFALETNPEGKVVVHRLRLEKTGKEMRDMEGGASWGLIYGALDKMLPGNRNKWVAINAFTGFENGKAVGHYALGGGKLAAFGGGTVGYWPSRLADVAKSFANRERIDPKRQFEDSAYRETVWANVSTALGATLHEMGHTFGLPHSPDRRSVMSRGFDFFNRTFMAYEPPHAKEPKELAVQQDMTARWDPFFAARLNWNPWFQPDAQAFDEGDGPKIELQGDEVVITAKHGLRVIGADRDDTEPVWQEVKGQPISESRLNRKELRQKMGDRPYRIVAVDSQGNQSVLEDK